MKKNEVLPPSQRRGRPPGVDSRYRPVAEDLRKRLAKGEWPRGAALPSMRELAKQYAVGTQVIRLALKLLRKEDRIDLNARRRAVAKNQGFLASATANLVALVLGHDLQVHWRSPITAAIQRGIEEGIGARHDPLLIVHDPKRLRAVVPPDLLELPLSGVLLLGQFLPAVLKEYLRINKPVVLVDRPGRRYGIASISVDNRQAAYLATKRLIEKGHRRIAFLRFVQLNLRAVDDDSREREEGYRQALQEAGLEPNGNDVFNTFPRDTTGSGYLKALFGKASPVTGVVACDGHQAKLILDAAVQAGKQVPRDLSLVCFQGKHATLAHVSGPRIDFVELGRRAVALLGRKSGNPNQLFEAEWADGITVAAPAVR